MLQPAQIRAARALLGWRQEQLAESADIGLATVRRIERGKFLRGNVTSLQRIQQALERAGVFFIEADRSGGMGVRLAQGRSSATELKRTRVKQRAQN